jgi:hypothetical protein
MPAGMPKEQAAEMAPALKRGYDGAGCREFALRNNFEE